MEGHVKSFSDARGWGFILTKTDEHFFVHYSQIREAGYKTLTRGELVSFDPKSGERGLSATNVVRLNPPATTKQPAKLIRYEREQREA